MKQGPTVPPAVRRVPTGLRRARGDAVACPGGPNINRAPIRDSHLSSLTDIDHKPYFQLATPISSSVPFHGGFTCHNRNALNRGRL